MKTHERRGERFTQILERLEFRPLSTFTAVSGIPRMTIRRIQNGEARWSSKPQWETLARVFGVSEEIVRQALDGEITVDAFAALVRPTIDKARAELVRKERLRRITDNAADRLEEDGHPRFAEEVRLLAARILWEQWGNEVPPQKAAELLEEAYSRVQGARDGILADSRFRPPSGTIRKRK